MRESKIVHVKHEDLILKDEDTGKLSIDTNLLDISLDAVSRDAVKVNDLNYLASRRFRVNTVELEKAFKIMREFSPVKKKKKKDEDADTA